MNKSLIIYFSHAKENYVAGSLKWLEEGNTKIVAHKIKQMTQADLFEILPLHDYPEDYHTCIQVAKEELNHQARPKFKNLICHLEQYSTIYLGYPNWWGTMPMIMFTMLENYDFKDKHIYPFCTHEGSELGQSMKDIKTLLPNSFIHSGLDIYGSKVNECDQILKGWLGEKLCQ